MTEHKNSKHHKKDKLDTLSMMSELQAAYELPPKEGMARLQELRERQLNSPFEAPEK